MLDTIGLIVVFVFLGVGMLWITKIKYQEIRDVLRLRERMRNDNDLTNVFRRKR